MTTGFRPYPVDADGDPYPTLRTVLAPRYAGAPPELIEAVVSRQFPNATAEDVEGFFDDVGRIAARALPGAATGAATGAALGPWGALGGALIGGVSSALSGGGGGAPAPRPPAAPPARMPPAGPAGSAAQPPPNAAGALLGLVQRPEVLQALMSMALGSAGRSNVPVGSSGVPVSSFANLIGALGQRAFAQSESLRPPSAGFPEYLYEGSNLAVDPGSSEQRAARLLELLDEAAPAPRAVSGPRFGLTEADEFYDELDMAELDEADLEADLEADERLEALDEALDEADFEAEPEYVYD